MTKHLFKFHNARIVNHRGEPVLLDIDTQQIIRKYDPDGNHEYDYEIKIPYSHFTDFRWGYNLIQEGNKATMTYSQGNNRIVKEVEVSSLSPIQKKNDVNIRFTEIKQKNNSKENDKTEEKITETKQI
jgi:hypothetical protein